MTSWRTNASTSRSRGQMWKGEAEVRICDAHDANEAGGEGPPLHQQHPFQPLQQSPIQQPWWEKKTGRSKSEADRYSFRVVREGWAGHREVTPKYSRMAFFSYALLLSSLPLGSQSLQHSQQLPGWANKCNTSCRGAFTFFSEVLDLHEQHIRKKSK